MKCLFKQQQTIIGNWLHVRAAMAAMASADGEKSMRNYSFWLDNNNLLRCDLDKLANHLIQSLEIEQHDANKFAKTFESYLQRQNLGRNFLLLLTQSEGSNAQLLLLKTILQSMFPDHVKQIFSEIDEHGRTPLDTLVMNNKDEMLKTILEAVKKDQLFEILQTKNSVGGTALHTACINDNPTAMWIIKEYTTRDQGRDEWYQLLEIADNNSRSPLAHALINFHKKSIKTIMESSLSGDQNQNYKLLVLFNKNYHIPPLHHLIMAARGDVMKHMKRNLQPEHWFHLLMMKDKDGFDRSGFMQAVVQGDTDMVRLIIEPLSVRQRCELLQLNDVTTGKTPLEWAAYRGKKDMIRHLLETMSDNQRYDLLKVKPFAEKTPLHWAVHGNHPEVVKSLLSQFETSAQAHLKRLLQARDSAGRTVLIWAVEKGSRETIYALLDAISAANLKRRLLFMTDTGGQTVLHYAASRGQEDIMKLIHGHLDTPKDDNSWLIKRQDCLGISPLLLAILQGNFDIVKLIIHSIPARVLVDLLLMKDDCGASCILAASWQSKANELFAELLASLSYDQRYQVLAETDKDYGWTVIHWAAWKARTELINMLCGLLLADQWYQLLQVVDDGGRTALHVAKLTYHLGNTEVVSTFQKLMNKDAWINLNSELEMQARQGEFMAIDDFKTPYQITEQTEVVQGMSTSTLFFYTCRFDAEKSTSLYS